MNNETNDLGIMHACEDKWEDLLISPIKASKGMGKAKCKTRKGL